jgi:putative salt-induced outer membrane protein YdiY
MKTTTKTILALGTALAACSATQTTVFADPATNAPWTGSVGAGLTLTRGNSRTLLTTLDLAADKKTAQDEWLLGANGGYGTASGVKNVESIDGKGQYNYLATDRLYYGLKIEALSDAIAGIDYRLTFSPLVGYYLIKDTTDSLAVEAGPAGVLQKLGPTTRGYATLRFGERYEHKFSDTAKLWQSFEFLPQVDKFSNYYWDGEIGVEAALTKQLHLRTYLDDTYYAIPATGRLKNDLKLVSGVVYKF